MDDDQIVYSRSLELVYCVFMDNGGRAHNIICDSISNGPDYLHDIFCCTIQIMSDFVAGAKAKNQVIKNFVSEFCGAMISDKDPQTCMDDYLDFSVMPKYAGVPYNREEDEEAIRRALKRLQKNVDRKPDQFAAAVKKLSDDEKNRLKRIKDKHERQKKDNNASDETEDRWGL